MWQRLGTIRVGSSCEKANSYQSLRISAEAGKPIIVEWGSTSPEFALESASAVLGSPWIPVKAPVAFGPNGSSVLVSPDA